MNGSREMIDAYIRPVEVHRPIPEALRERRRPMSASKDVMEGSPAMTATIDDTNEATPG